jgi:hypothetical protein
MDGFRRRLGLAAALCVLPALAAAGNGIDHITLRHEPNLTSVAVQAIVSGDDDTTAVLRIFQKWHENAAYDTGMVMVRRLGTHIYEGRILWMTPDRLADYYVEGRDGGTNYNTAPHLARAASIRPIVATGPVFYADQRHGSDAWDGTRRAWSAGSSGPKRTIGAALKALAASPLAGKNGGVFVAPGEYHERLTLDFGTDGDYHFLEGDRTDRDSTIICGANPWVEQGQWAPGYRLAWALTQDSTYVTLFPGTLMGSSPGDSTQLVVIGWGEYVHRKTSVKAILDDSTYIGKPYSTNEGELSGWFWRHDSLYVKRANGQSPAGLVLHTGYLDNLIYVQRRNWRIANLTLRFSGGSTGDPTHPANPDPGLSGHGIVAGRLGVASGLVVDSCRIYGHNADPIYVVHGSSGGYADSVTIAHCIVDGLTVGRMSYGAGKGRSEERVGQVMLLSRAANVFDNLITGGFNGLELGPGDNSRGPRDSTIGSQCEVAYNTIERVADDGIELDTSHCINTLLLGNTVRDAGHGISIVPTYSGPTWVFYNTIANSQHGGLKVGTGTTGITWLIHNTFTASNVGGWAIDGSPGGPVDNLHFRNNIMVARGRNSGYTIWGPSAASRTTNDFNYDLVDSLGTLRLISWGGSTYSFPALQSALGWERNGVRAPPAFVDSASGDWDLSQLSAGVGRGQRISGVNTSLDGPRYRGKPDIGARSLPALADTAPLHPIAILGLAALAAPNPFRAEGTLEYTLPAAAEVTVRLFDPAGRVMRTLLDHHLEPAGRYRLPLDGNSLRPGVYLYQVVAGAEQVHGKLVLLR